MNYATLKKTDCSKYVEKKGKFSYISWPYMVDQLRTQCPEATIHARQNTDGMPYFLGNAGAMVETYILLDKKEVWNEWLPVMDFKNKAIINPNAMDINKTIQRCKAKCISEYLGIGLYLYMGEDLPENTYLDEMKGFAINESDIYKEVLNSWQVTSAKQINKPEEQTKILAEIKEKLAA